MLRNSSGMALLITLAAISFLVAVTVQLATSVNWQVQASTNQMEAVRLNAALYSGLSLLRASLYADQQQEEKFDSLHDGWNTLDVESARALLGGDALSLTVQDMSGRIQLNKLWLSPDEIKEFEKQFKEDPNNRNINPPDPQQLQRDLWQRFLLSGKFAVEDADEAISLIEALSDWLDEDDNERDHGAESGFYQSLDKPYVCRNGPLQYPEELLLVKGFSRKILYGDEEHQGIINHLTVFGKDGKININTASPPVLQALAEDMDEEMAGQLVEFRSDLENLTALENREWYSQVNDLPVYIGANLNKNKELLTTESSYFFCTITAGRNGLQQRGEGYIYRDAVTYEQNLLSWKVD